MSCVSAASRRGAAREASGPGARFLVPPEDFGAARARRRIERQEILAQRGEVLGDSGKQGSYFAALGQRAGKHLAENAAEAVPVGRLRE